MEVWLKVGCLGLLYAIHTHVEENRQRKNSSQVDPNFKTKFFILM